jgi:hypothetical protein
MKFSEHILIERALDDIESQLLTEGLGDVTEYIKQYIASMKSIGTKVKSRIKECWERAL